MHGGGAEERHGSVVGVDFLCGTVGLQLDILSNHKVRFFVVFLYLVMLRNGKL